MGILYTLFIHLYTLLIRIASFRSSKASQWTRGRKGLFRELMSRSASSLKQGNPVYWFHCASLGEFEQGRPLMEKLKKDIPGCRIVLSFFSPSGYNIRKNYPVADLVTYLPADTPGNAKKFLDIIHPDHVFFIKYEFWYNFLSELRKRKIPHYLVSGIFRADQPFFRWYGSWFRKALHGYSRVFVQDKASEDLLKSRGISGVEVCGDTRFDRVSQVASEAGDHELVKQFCQGSRVLVCGSTWPKDESILSAWLNTAPADWKLILAPHVTDAGHISAIESLFRPWGTIRYSVMKDAAKGERVLIIDSTGLLASLYRYGQIAYIGGGFGSGIHNTLEAAVYGIPVIFGPNFSRFREAVEMLECGAAFTISGEEDLKKRMDFLVNDPLVLRMAGMVSKDYVLRGRGATGRILEAALGNGNLRS